MHPMLLYFDLFVLLTGVYSSYMFPMENEMIDKVYYELRDLVKMKTSMVNKTAKDSNENISSSKSNFKADDSHMVEMKNKTRKTETFDNLKINSSAVKDTKDSSSSFNKDIKLNNRTEASEKLQSKVDVDNSKTNQTDKTFTSSNPIQQDNHNKNMSGKVGGEKSANSSTRTLNSYQSNDVIMNAIVHEIKNILPVKVRHKRMQSLQLTDEIEDVLPNEKKGKAIPFRGKRNTGKETLFGGELTDEIEDILPVLKENGKESSHAIRRKREIEEGNTIDGELTNEIKHLMGHERKKRKFEDEKVSRDKLTDEIEDILEWPVRTKRNSEDGTRMDDAITHGSELTDEIQDVRLERREHVPIRTRSAGSHTLWDPQPNFQPNSDDVPNISTNRMHHNRHFVENDQHHIPSDHSIRPEENEHAYHQERGHSNHFNDNSGHHHSRHDVHNREHEHEIQSHHEEESQEPRKEHWSSYHHGKFHHVKVKLHGPGKSPSEWARQEQQELAEYPGVIYDSGVYHDVGMDAGFYLMRCEDCIS